MWTRSDQNHSGSELVPGLNWIFRASGLDILGGNATYVTVYFMLCGWVPDGWGLDYMSFKTVAGKNAYKKVNIEVTKITKMTLNNDILGRFGINLMTCGLPRLLRTLKH